MILAKGASPRAIRSWRALIVVGAALLAGCQSATEAPPPEVRTEAWRVIERVGEARYLAPGTSSWAAALPATDLPDGSRVATGSGGRLILARSSDHLSAGPGSQFRLPAAGPGAVLEQAAGRLRYRLSEPQPLAITAPALAIEAQGGVFDVAVGSDATEVALERGRLRVATADGGREIELKDGQSARTGAHGGLAFQRAGGQPFEPVERIVVPALQPKAAQPKAALAEGAPPGSALTAARAAAHQASTSAAASVQSAVAVAPARPSAGEPEPPLATAPAVVPAASPTTAATTGAGVPAVADAPTNAKADVPAAADAPMVAPAPEGAPADDQESSRPPAPDADPATAVVDPGRRLLFDRLTEGMIEAVPARPASREPSAHARSI